MTGSKMLIEPPLLNSSSPWATTLEDLKTLYQCRYTGAITTRTSLIRGFQDDASRHQHCFFTAGHSVPKGSGVNVKNGDGISIPEATSSLNTYGYSPIPLKYYLEYIEQILDISSPHDSELHVEPTSAVQPPRSKQSSKLIIISVTGDADEIGQAYGMITNLARSRPGSRLAMEINLSCPNIAKKPPPAYDGNGLQEYLRVVAEAKEAVAKQQDDSEGEKRESESLVPVGIKLPPYTYAGQFNTLVHCLRVTTTAAKETTSASASEVRTATDKGKVGQGHEQEQQPPKHGNGQGEGEGARKVGKDSKDKQRSIIDFITSTNTLGSTLVLDEENEAALRSESGTGIGGTAGSAIHSLSLGNVSILRRLLDEHEETNDIFVIGVGGVADRAGYLRMRRVGAGAVAVATALGRDGVAVFGNIIDGV